MTNDKLAALDKAHETACALEATQGEIKAAWDRFTTTLVTTYRAGELVPVSLDTDTAGLVKRLRTKKLCKDGIRRAPQKHEREAANRIEAQDNALRTITAERDALAKRVGELEEANGIPEDASQEVGDDDPWSPYEAWCQQQVKLAHATLKGTDHG